jgi:hypothetical protein
MSNPADIIQDVKLDLCEAEAHLAAGDGPGRAQRVENYRQAGECLAKAITRLQNAMSKIDNRLMRHPEEQVHA